MAVSSTPCSKHSLNKIPHSVHVEMNPRRDEGNFKLYRTLPNAESACNRDFWRLNRMGYSVQSAEFGLWTENYAWLSRISGVSMANSFKFSTLLWLVAGFLIPLWPISLPFCWFMAYRSYKKGSDPRPSLADLQSAVELNKAGVLSDDELERVRAKALGAGSSNVTRSA